MPFMYAHACCAELALLTCRDGLLELLSGERPVPLARTDEAHALANRWHSVYRWGAQGPDIWFFHGILRPFGSKRGVGNMLHAKDVDTTMAAFFDCCRSAVGAEKERRFAYFAGFLTHYALDSTAHPFVHSRCGKPCHHSEFEAECDTELLAIAGKSPAKCPPKTVMPALSEADKRAIVDMYSAVLKACGAKAGEKDVREILRVAPKWHKRMADSTGGKRRALLKTERLLHLPNIASRFIFPTEPVAGHDALNLSRGEWRVPWSKEVRTDDLLFLIEKAADRAVVYMNAAYDGIFGKAEREAVLEILGDLSLDNGLHWRESFVEERCFDGIYGD